MKKRKQITLFLELIGLLVAILVCTHVSQAAAADTSLVEPNYAVTEQKWLEEYKPIDSFSKSIFPQEMTHVGELVRQAQYSTPVVKVASGQSINFTVQVPKTGLYQFKIAYYSLAKGLIDPEAGIKVNGHFPFYESRRIVFPGDWRDKSPQFISNSKGNELIPEQSRVSMWNELLVSDPNAMQPSGFYFLLRKGANRITLTGTSSSFYIGKWTIQSSPRINVYHAPAKDQLRRTASVLETVEAEHVLFKNNSYARPLAVSDPSTVPSDGIHNLLNAFGGKSWNTSGQSATWQFTVPQDGYYRVTYKALVNYKNTSPVFRTIKIDGGVPFGSLTHYRFSANSKWTNVTLGGKEAYEFYLKKGAHQIEMIADASPVAKTGDQLSAIMQEINDMGLSIKKLTGNSVDATRDWKLSEYIPNLNQKFKKWITELKEIRRELNQIYGDSAGRSQEATQIKQVSDQLLALSKSPDDLPNRLSELSEGSSSVTQMLGDTQTVLDQQPMAIDRIYVHGSSAKLPESQKSFWVKLRDGAHRFFNSFFANSETKTAQTKTIKVWVARSQQYVELMQNMADSTFSKQTGIKVVFSVMPNEQKLILANSSDQQPDVALGVAVGTPYELAIRGAAYDLSKFSDFKQVAKQFAPGAFPPMVINDKFYALPETQDFYVQFARDDILSKLNIKTPTNWNEVIDILPELQRYGLNYYVPLSGNAGTKPFMFTAPFIYQYGGELYNKNGFSTAINQQKAINGLKFMTDLFTTYSLPMQVPSFYNSFRYGTLPIGISNFQTYVQLKSAAPEIANSWSLSLYPGVVQSDGSVSRWATGSAQSAMMFAKTKQPNESWQFLKWWESTNTQTTFAKNLQTSYGPEYMWNTANMQAFKELPWPEEDKKVILEQWQSMREVPKTPGSYILEREISNVWTDVVFNGVNIRSSIDNRVISIDHEMRRKMEEFNYLRNGKTVRNYEIPTLQRIEVLLNEK
jgi:ABC-type glycerol-3-phosphate transport system substrate-binding protein